MKRMLASKEDLQQCKILGLEYLKSFYTLCPLIISFPLCCIVDANTSLRLARHPVLASPVAPSWLRPSLRLGFARRSVLASPVAPSWLRPSLRLGFARRSVLASPVAPSWLRPSLRLGFARRSVLASPVAPSWLRPSLRLGFARRSVLASPVAPSWLRPSLRLGFARHPIFTSPVVSSSPLGHPLFTSPPRLCGIVEFRSGSAVLLNGLYAMGGTVAQAVWLKVDRRGNVPVGTFPFSML
ncbi:hypothetical protein OUZ56_029258 [Daphnia magna]|uniref:Uncharacterized protein n=1 Tax=Daphnia magna TaxID=35525 RepID=A0ABR0B6A3_9CRUS|nr:hypothetical protein OUZ56_029258 [Daphnia magna]